jgi:uncharacterized protein YjbI with pentapeptide repeats
MTENLRKITPQELGAILADYKPNDDRLAGRDFSGFPLSRRRVTNAILDDSAFVGADLSYSIIVESFGAGCDFSRANMSNMFFYKTSLTAGTVFTGASMTDVIFVQCEINNANFSGTDLSTVTFLDCNLGGSTYDKGTVFPDGFDPAYYGMVQV